MIKLILFTIFTLLVSGCSHTYLIDKRECESISENHFKCPKVYKLD